MQRVSAENVADLACRLNSTAELERLQAQDDLRVLMAADVRRLSRIQKATRAARMLYVLVFVPILFFDLITGHHEIIHGSGAFAGLFLGLFYLQAYVQRKIARPLIALDLPQAVGPLIDVLATSDVLRDQEINDVLIRLLPRLQASDANLLLPRHRKYLNQFLGRDASWLYPNTASRAELKIAILRTLEQVGDKTSLPAVEKLAKSAANLQVRLAAQDCLPFLQQRVDHSNTQQTLLRASGADAAPEVLLRPASSGEEAAPEQLLRASTLDKT